ncbi:MAG TPA: M24 family metallopeptidase [Gemmatimonadales bacterium]|nr:M24 family metallopeptidase [Gemmatimonadales bacterium]
MSPFTGLDRSELAAALDEAGADAWLLFDFHGLNPVAGRVLGLAGMGTRRIFVLLPRSGDPVAVAHRVELQSVDGFPGQVVPYARWEELNDALGRLVGGRTVAMEISPEDAVPYLDRVPFGVVELLRKLGACVVPSGPLVSRFAARWNAREIAEHVAAAEALAEVARAELGRVVNGPAVTETAVQRRVVEALGVRGLIFDHPPIVAFGPNTANPHYEPVAGRDATLRPGDVVLLDLWGRKGTNTVFADQTWMGFAGARPLNRVELVWRTVRDARDAAIAAVRDAAQAGRPIAGFEADRAARAVVSKAGFGEWFVHRTGHSIDRDLHGSGPHLDDYETHDDRRLGPGLGFSVEPGVYLPGEFGVRSEVNMYWGPDGPQVTPREPQRELITARA